MKQSNSTANPEFAMLLLLENICNTWCGTKIYVGTKFFRTYGPNANYL